MPKKNSNGEYVFNDYPEFRPNLSPRDIFKLGSFGGTYWRPIYSSVVNKNLKDIYKQYPATWFKSIPINHLTLPYDQYDKTINKYKVKVGTTLEYWENKGWISANHPYGWVHWYCDFYQGKRCEDDEYQIKRWKEICGKKGRFKLNLINQIKNNNKLWDDASISPKIRQTLQHWAYALTKKDFDEHNV
jgi:hypothetical protein